jgi:hypothetical protein
VHAFKNRIRHLFWQALTFNRVERRWNYYIPPGWK